MSRSIRPVIFLILFLMLSPPIITAQCGKRQFYGKAGITFSGLGDNAVLRFTELEGAGSFDGTGFHSLGINYVVGMNSWIEFETGLEYSKHNLIITASPNPEIQAPPVEAGLALITVPLTIRVNFLRYFFVNGGAMPCFDASAGSLNGSPVDSQTGIGALLGVGLKYDFSTGASVFVNPYTRYYSLLPFSSGRFHQRVAENGFRIGIAWDLEKL